MAASPGRPGTSTRASAPTVRAASMFPTSANSSMSAPTTPPARSESHADRSRSIASSFRPDRRSSSALPRKRTVSCTPSASIAATSARSAASSFRFKRRFVRITWTAIRVAPDVSLIRVSLASAASGFPARVSSLASRIPERKAKAGMASRASCSQRAASARSPRAAARDASTRIGIGFLRLSSRARRAARSASSSFP